MLKSSLDFIIMPSTALLVISDTSLDRGIKGPFTATIKISKRYLVQYLYNHFEEYHQNIDLQNAFNILYTPRPGYPSIPSGLITKNTLDYSNK
jgi:hypothetical protein